MCLGPAPPTTHKMKRKLTASTAQPRRTQVEEGEGDRWRRVEEAGGEGRWRQVEVRRRRGSLLSCESCWSFLPPASRVASTESGWTAGPGPPQSPAPPPSQLSSPSARPHRDGTDESLWLTADSEDGGQTVTLSSSPALGVTPLSVTYLFSGPDAALELLPQPVETVVPPADLLVLLQPPPQLLH